MSQARALCIPPLVLALPAVSWPARLVLSEVLALHKAQGCVWAQDEYFVTRCLLSLRTVQAAVKELVGAGLLERLTKQSAQHKRVLTPTLPTEKEAETPADSASATPDLLQDLREPTADFAATSRRFRGNLPRILREPTAESAGIIYKVIKEENKESEDAASAATPTSSFLGESSKKNKGVVSRKKPAARTDEVAALELPHPSAEFAQLWAEFRAMPKQVKKPVTSLRRLLATLGKYAEGFACQMLDKAIQSDWSGVEYESTPEAYAKWLAAEAERTRRQPMRTTSPTTDEPLTDFERERRASEQAELDRQNADYRLRHGLPPLVKVDPDALFGYNQSAADGIAQAQATPEYQQYLAELAAQQQAIPSDSAQTAP